MYTCSCAVMMGKGKRIGSQDKLKRKDFARKLQSS